VHVDHVCLLERFLQFARDFVGRGLDATLHDLGRTCKRLVEFFSGGWPANRDEPGLAGREFRSRLMKLLAGQRPAPNYSGMTRMCAPIHRAQIGGFARDGVNRTLVT
jgi:hypothetical protein